MPSDPHIMSGNDLAVLLHAEFPNAMQHIADLTYARVTRTGVTRLHSFMGKHLWTFRITGWATYFDCDDYARLAHVLAAVMHRKGRRQNVAPDAEAVAFGQVWYMIDNGGGHAINWVVTERGLETWEPQTGRFTDLSRDERRSAWYVCA